MSNVAERLASVLQHPAISAVNFSLDGNRYDAEKLRKVGRLLASGHIRVVSESLDGSAAGYRLDTNTLYWTINPQKSATVANAHWLVHEAIHAVQDANRYPCTTATAEAAAYIGQVVFFVASCADDDSEVARTRKAAQVEQAAAGVDQELREMFQLIAAGSRVARSKRLYAGSHVDLRTSDVAELIHLIQLSSRYSQQAGLQFATDGISTK